MLVVGAGPTGLVLACLLAQAGVDVAVVERRIRPRGFSRAIGLHPPAQGVLGRIGVEAALLAEGLPVHSGRARSRGRALGSLSFERAWPARPFVLTLPQNRTEALLAHRLAEHAPRALWRGWEVTDVVEDDEGATVTASFTDPRSADRGSQPRTWRTGIVVGADGPRSVVRRHAGIGSRVRDLPDTYLMGDFPDAGGGPAQGSHADERSSHDRARSSSDRARSSSDRTALVHLEPGGVVEAFPLPEGRRRWVVHTGMHGVAASPERLARIVAARTGEWLDPGAATMISAFAVRRRIARRMVRGRCVIIGDAAHEVSPIGGQGMSLGLLDAADLAPLLMGALAADPPEGHEGLEAFTGFADFERQRLRAARRAARQAELNMIAGRPMSRTAATARDLLLRGLLGTPARAALARAFTMRWSSSRERSRRPGAASRRPQASAQARETP